MLPLHQRRQSTHQGRNVHHERKSFPHQDVARRFDVVLDCCQTPVTFLAIDYTLDETIDYTVPLLPKAANLRRELLRMKASITMLVPVPQPLDALLQKHQATQAASEKRIEPRFQLLACHVLR